MLLKLEELEAVKKEHMRNGEGHVLLNSWSAEDRMFAQITIPVGSSIGVHTHIDDEETIYILQGTGKCIIDTVEHPIEKGMVNYCPEGNNHSIVNDGEEDLKLFAIIRKTNLPKK